MTRRERIGQIVGGIFGAAAVALMFARAVPYNCEPTWWCRYLWLCCIERF